jgi:hypothetical protein
MILRSKCFTGKATSFQGFSNDLLGANTSFQGFPNVLLACWGIDLYGSSAAMRWCAPGCRRRASASRAPRLSLPPSKRDACSQARARAGAGARTGAMSLPAGAPGWHTMRTHTSCCGAAATAGPGTAVPGFLPLPFGRPTGRLAAAAAAAASCLRCLRTCRLASTSRST